MDGISKLKRSVAITIAAKTRPRMTIISMRKFLIFDFMTESPTQAKLRRVKALVPRIKPPSNAHKTDEALRRNDLNGKPARSSVQACP